VTGVGVSIGAASIGSSAIGGDTHSTTGSRYGFSVLSRVTGSGTGESPASMSARPACSWRASSRNNMTGSQHCLERSADMSWNGSSDNPMLKLARSLDTTLGTSSRIR